MFCCLSLYLCPPLVCVFKKDKNENCKKKCKASWWLNINKFPCLYRPVYILFAKKNNKSLKQKKMKRRMTKRKRMTMVRLYHKTTVLLT